MASIDTSRTVIDKYRYFSFIMKWWKNDKIEKPEKNLKYFSREIWKISERNIKQNFSETSPKSRSNYIYASYRNGLILHTYNFCTAIYVETAGKIFGKFKSMFLEVFFRFLSNFGDNFVKNPRKFWSYLGEITRKIKNLGENCKILRHYSWEM